MSSTTIPETDRAIMDGMPIHVPKTKPAPKVHAKKARTIARGGGIAEFVGDRRHLRRIRDELARDDDLETFLGADDGGGTHLVVELADNGSEWTAPRDRV